MDTASPPSVFISYSKEDRKWLDELSTMLAPVVRAGIASVWSDRKIRPSQIWRQEIDKALASARLGLLLVSDNFLASGFIQDNELPYLIEASQSRRVKLLWVLVSPCLHEYSPLQKIQAAHYPLIPLTKLSKAKRQDALANICRAAVDALGSEASAQEERANQSEPTIENSSRVPRPPYPGLKPFTPDDAEFFFGREELTKSLLRRLGENHFLALVGSSGSGKSSLIYAGLVPELRKGVLIPGSSTWEPVPIKPGRRPLSDLAGRLSPFFVGYQESFSDWHTEFVLKMKNDSRALYTAIQQHSPLHLLVIVDQCENILSQNPASPDLEEHQSFFSNLLNASSLPEPKATLVLALRAEFYGDVDKFPDLASRVGDHQALLSPLQERELRQAIISPAEKMGLRLEEGLPESILRDLRGHRYAMPLLQEALYELWNQRDGTLLTFAAYNSFGGVEGAITSSAEAAFAELSTNQQKLARRILEELVLPGENTPDTRQRVPRRDLIKDPTHSQETQEVVMHLIHHRLLLSEDSDPSTREGTVELAHDALFEKWPRLHEWIQKDHAALLSLKSLRERVRSWEQHHRHDGSLVGGPELEEYERLGRDHPDWLSVPQKEYMATCIRNRRLATQGPDLVYFNGINPRGQYLTPPLPLRQIVERLLAEEWQATPDWILR